MFGGLYDDSILDASVPNAVYQFFLNGGTNAIVVGLKPKYLPTTTGGGTPARTDVVPAEATVGTIKFVGRQLTDSANPISITIRNISGNGADILITHRSTTELYRGRHHRVRRLWREHRQHLHREPSGGVEPRQGGADGRDLSGDLPDAAGVRRPERHDRRDAPAGRPIFAALDFTNALQADSSPWTRSTSSTCSSSPASRTRLSWNAALDFCEEKRAFFIMDPATQLVRRDRLGARLHEGRRPGEPRAPRIRAQRCHVLPLPQDDRPRHGQAIELPPERIRGRSLCARTDTNRGVWKAPAGLEQPSATRPVSSSDGRMTDMRQGTLNPLGVNVLRTFPGIGTVVFGARTLAHEPRPGAVALRASAPHGAVHRADAGGNLGWVVFEPNDEPLWVADPDSASRPSCCRCSARAHSRAPRRARPSWSSATRDHDPDGHRPGHRQHRRRVRAAQARRVRDHQDRAARRPGPGVSEERPMAKPFPSTSPASTPTRTTASSCISAKRPRPWPA